MSNKAPKVFVVHENLDMNFTDAERFGEVVFVTNREWNPRRGSLTNADTLSQIRSKIMGEFDPLKDYVILNGPPALLGYAFHVAFAKVISVNAPGLRLLTWDKFARRYIEGIVENA